MTPEEQQQVQDQQKRMADQIVGQARGGMEMQADAFARASGANMAAAIDSANAIGDRNAIALMRVGADRDAARAEVQRLTAKLEQESATVETLTEKVVALEKGAKTSPRRRSSRGGK